MTVIDNKTQDTLLEYLTLYYSALNSGDLELLSSIMTEESYLITLDSFGFKRAFGDKNFKQLLKDMHDDKLSLEKVENVLREDISKESKESKIDIIRYESNGSSRITLHYNEDVHPKKLYFSNSSGKWEIDYKAGRKKG